MIELTKTSRTSGGKDTLVVLSDLSRLRSIDLERNDRQYLLQQLEGDGQIATCDISGRLVMVHKQVTGTSSAQLEHARRAGNEMVLKLIAAKRTDAQVVSLQEDATLTMALLEGAALGAYAFTKYKTDDKGPKLRKLNVIASEVPTTALKALTDLCQATCTARDLVNEPASTLTAEGLAQAAQAIGKDSGFTVKVMNKAQIEKLGMGGLLAVNQGSIDPPTFTVMEWKPKNAVNKKPIVLVGKGVVYDTGGLSLKPTPNSMDAMKCDMGGAAAVIGAISATAKAKLPVHVVALVPSTDNRPGGNAYAPGDVIRMHSGLTVENMNSDAEGRIILADALSYSERYDAETVITVATLTGAAMRAIGTYGTVTMGTATKQQFDRLHAAGDSTFERVAQMPFWEEYGEEINSDIADIKNIGGPLAGQITAGKFLARFTTKPLIHLDIAGPAFLDKRDHYRTKGGTGIGVRLIHEYLKRRASEK